MPVFDLGEARLRQVRPTASAANADILYSPSPPADKIWCVMGCGYYPSVNETQIVQFSKVFVGIGEFAILNPLSMNLNPMVATFLEQGMELILYPNEVIAVRRANHTAGSTMNLNIEIVEVDFPLYQYEEPQVVKRRRVSVGQFKDVVSGGGSRVSIMPVERGGPNIFAK